VSAAFGPSVAGFPALVALVAGLAVLIAATVLSRQGEVPYSAALVYLLLGAGLATLISAFDVDWIDPLAQPAAVQHVASAVIVLALFATGIRLDRELAWAEWGSVTRLLVGAMPIVVIGAAALSAVLLDVSLGIAIVLGSLLAPTDPVLAGEIGVGPPGEGREREERFAVTGEAGLNDGLALVGVTLGLVLLDPADSDLARWFAGEVVYSLLAGVAVGVLVGRSAAWIAVRARDREHLAPSLDPFVGIGSAFVLFGAAETVAANGFIAVFVGALAFGRYERRHELNRGVFEGLERSERLGELAAIVLLGSMLSLDGLRSIGWEGWLVALAVLLVLRPLSVVVSFVASNRTPAERAFLAWFGVRGLASLYYAAAVAASGELSEGAAALVWWTAVATVVLSIVAHGLTGTRGVDLVERAHRFGHRPRVAGPEHGPEPS
jgi:sodium/hydrogen antiporter